MHTEITGKTITLDRLLRDECFQLPIRRREEESYLECLKRVIHDEYLLKLQRLRSFYVQDRECISELTNAAQELADAIIKCVEIYYSGNIGSAYNLFREALEQTNHQLQGSKGISGLFIKARELQETTSLFRIRRSMTKPLTEREELFHIPMKQRENVVTQRFSIEGNPSLYLGSSLFICWKESNLPDIWSCYAARYEITDPDYLFLDIRNWLPKFRRNHPANKEDESALFYYLSLWPLVAACSVRVSFDDKPFKPEYIIPQFLYQYTSELKSAGRTAGSREQKVLGLVYSSTRTESWEDYDPEKEYNLAIPVHQTDHENFSKELSQALQLTRPVSWKTILEHPLEANGLKTERSSAEHYFYHIGKSFSQMEDALTKEPVAHLDQPDR